MEGAKEDFLSRFGDDYGYPNALKDIDKMRSTEFKRLEGYSSLLPRSFAVLFCNSYVSPSSYRGTFLVSVICRARLFGSCWSNSLLGGSVGSHFQRPIDKSLWEPTYSLVFVSSAKKYWIF